MARFPEYDDCKESFEKWSIDFDYNTVEARRCLEIGDVGKCSFHLLQWKVGLFFLRQTLVPNNISDYPVKH